MRTDLLCTVCALNAEFVVAFHLLSFPVFYGDESLCGALSQRAGHPGDEDGDWKLDSARTVAGQLPPIELGSGSARARPGRLACYEALMGGADY